MSVVPQKTLFLWEAIDLLSSTTVLGAFYGISFTLYCLCARSLYLQLQVPDKRRQARFALGYTSFLFLCATCILAINARLDQVSYINHADYPGGPLLYEVTHSQTTDSYVTAGATFIVIIEVLTTAIQVCR